MRQSSRAEMPLTPAGRGERLSLYWCRAQPLHGVGVSRARGSKAGCEAQDARVKPPRVLDKGVDPEDLTDIVRAEQYEVIYNVCQLLDGEWLSDLREKIPELHEFSWRLYEVAVDDDYVATPVRAIEDLHSMLGEVDPTGREGEPRKR
mgnify:CR=1 FL=1